MQGNNTKKTNNAGEQGRKDPAIKPGAWGFHCSRSSKIPGKDRRWKKFWRNFTGILICCCTCSKHIIYSFTTKAFRAVYSCYCCLTYSFYIVTIFLSLTCFNKEKRQFLHCIRLFQIISVLTSLYPETKIKRFPLFLHLYKSVYINSLVYIVFRKLRPILHLWKMWTTQNPSVKKWKDWCELNMNSKIRHVHLYYNNESQKMWYTSSSISSPIIFLYNIDLLHPKLPITAISLKQMYHCLKHHDLYIFSKIHLNC